MITQEGLKMVSKWIALIVYISLGFSESALVDTITKCALKDGECQKDVIQKFIVEYSQTGLPEYKIPPFDPVNIKNVKVSLLGLLNITVEDADCIGMKDCIINSFTPNMEKGFNDLEVTCDLEVKGKVMVSGSSPIDNLFEGKAIHGDSNAEVKIDKLHMSFTFFYDLVKKEDGEIYFSFKFNQTEYIYDLQNFHATIDNIFLGEEDVSERFVAYLNENWRFVFATFGKTVFNTALDLLQETVNSLMDIIPASKVISDDLTPYIKNK